MIDKIQLQFDQPVNYGHWSAIRIYNSDNGELFDKFDMDTSESRSRITMDKMNGEVVLHVQKPFEKGETYRVEMDMGAFVSLDYQPSNVLVAEDYEFSIEGGSCLLRRLQTCEHLLVLEPAQPKYISGETARIRCESGFAAEFQPNERLRRISTDTTGTAVFEIECRDGEWALEGFACRRSCSLALLETKLYQAMWQAESDDYESEAVYNQPIVLSPSLEYVDEENELDEQLYEEEDKTVQDYDPEYTTEEEIDTSDFDGSIGSNSFFGTFKSRGFADELKFFVNENEPDEDLHLELNEFGDNLFENGTQRSKSSDSEFQREKNVRAAKWRAKSQRGRSESEGGSGRKRSGIMRSPESRDLLELHKRGFRRGTQELPLGLNDFRYELKSSGVSGTGSQIEMRNRSYSVTLIRFTDLSGTDVSENSSVVQALLNHGIVPHGSELDIRCLNSRFFHNTAGSTVCRNGEWSATNFLCEPSCGPLDLDPALYAYKENVGYSKVGSSISISCAPNTKGDTKLVQVLHCTEKLQWTPLKIRCLAYCAESEMYALQSAWNLQMIARIKAPDGNQDEILVHRCAPGYAQVDSNEDIEAEPQLFTGVPECDTSEQNSATCVRCTPSGWRFNRAVQCQKACGPPELPPAYQIAPLELEPGAPNSVVSIGCSLDAYSPLSHGLKDTMKCVNGNWVRSLRRVQCYASCSHPRIQLNSNYIVLANGQVVVELPAEALVTKMTYPHYMQERGARFSTAPSFAIRCKPYSQPVLLSVPVADRQDSPYQYEDLFPRERGGIMLENPEQSIMCDDGRWVPAARMRPSHGSISANRHLHCLQLCTRLPKMRSEKYDQQDTRDFSVQMASSVLSCAHGNRGGRFSLDDVGHLRFEPASEIRLECYDGAWITAADDGTLKALERINLAKPARLNNYFEVFRDGDSRQVFERRVYALLQCGSPCNTASLSPLLQSQKVQLIEPLRSSEYPHGGSVSVQCLAHTKSLFGRDHDEIFCVDGEWSVPQLDCFAHNEIDEFFAVQTSKMMRERWNEFGECRQLPSVPNESQLESEPLARWYIAKPGFETINATAVEIYDVSAAQNLEFELAQIPAVVKLGAFEDPLRSPTTQPLLTTPQYFVCSGLRWALASGQRSLGSNHANTCANLRADRGELGPDCGGVCERQCSSCFDGIQNGDEEWIDCGGSCQACEDCDLAALARFQSENYLLKQLSPAEQHKRVSALDTVLPTYANMLEVTCSRGSAPLGNRASIILVCLNGVWWPLEMLEQSARKRSLKAQELASKFLLHELTCSPRSKLPLQQRFLAGTSLLPTNLRFKVCENSALANEPAVEAFCSAGNAYAQFFRAETGLLLQTGSVESICRGSGATQLVTLQQSVEMAVKHISTLTNEFKYLLPTAQMLQRSLTLLCSQPSFAETEIAGLTESLRPVNFCVEALGLTYQHLNGFSVYVNGFAQTAVCRPESCFRNNVEFLSLVWRLINSDQTLHEFRQDQDLDGSVTEKPEAAALTRFIPLIENLRYSPDAVDLICMASSCLPFLKMINDHLLTWNVRVSDFMFSDKLLLMKKYNALGLNANHDCLRKILSGLSQVITRRSTQTKNPFMRFVGLLLLEYGRYLKEKSPDGKLCSTHVIGDLLDTWEIQTRARPAGQLTSFTTAIKQLAARHNLPECGCAVSKINNGRCDLECFVPECGYDGIDCLFSQQFPDLYAKLTNGLTTNRNCTPYLLSEIDLLDPECEYEFESIAVSEKCCLTIREKVLRDVVDADLQNHPTLRTKSHYETELRRLMFDQFRDAEGSYVSVLEKTLENRESRAPVRPLLLKTQRFCSFTDHQSVRLLLVASQIDFDAVIALKPELTPSELFYLAQGKLFLGVQNEPEFYNKLVALTQLQSRAQTHKLYYNLQQLVAKIVADALTLPIGEVAEVTFNRSDDGAVLANVRLNTWSYDNSFIETIRSLIDTQQLDYALDFAISDWLRTLSPQLQYFLSGDTKERGLNETNLNQALEMERFLVEMPLSTQVPQTEIEEGESEDGTSTSQSIDNIDEHNNVKNSDGLLPNNQFLDTLFDRILVPMFETAQKIEDTLLEPLLTLGRHRFGERINNIDRYGRILFSTEMPIYEIATDHLNEKEDLEPKPPIEEPRDKHYPLVDFALDQFVFPVLNTAQHIEDIIRSALPRVNVFNENEVEKNELNLSANEPGTLLQESAVATIPKNQRGLTDVNRNFERQQYTGLDSNKTVNFKTIHVFATTSQPIPQNINVLENYSWSDNIQDGGIVVHEQNKTFHELEDDAQHRSMRNSTANCVQNGNSISMDKNCNPFLLGGDAKPRSARYLIQEQEKPSPRILSEVRPQSQTSKMQIEVSKTEERASTLSQCDHASLKKQFSDAVEVVASEPIGNNLKDNILTVQCSNRRSGTQKLICVNGAWESLDREPLLNCQHSCSAFSNPAILENPTMYKAVVKSFAPNGIAEISCANDYNAKSSTFTCVDGKWVGTMPECTTLTRLSTRCGRYDLYDLGFDNRLNFDEIHPNLYNHSWWYMTCKNGFFSTSLGTSRFYAICFRNQDLLFFRNISVELRNEMQRYNPSISRVEMELSNMVTAGIANGTAYRVALGQTPLSKGLVLESTIPQYGKITVSCGPRRTDGNPNRSIHVLNDYAYIFVVLASAAIFITFFVGFAVCCENWRRRRSQEADDDTAPTENNIGVQDSVSRVEEPANSYYSDAELYAHRDLK